MTDSELLQLLDALAATPGNRPLRDLVRDRCIASRDALAMRSFLDLCGHDTAMTAETWAAVQAILSEGETSDGVPSTNHAQEADSATALVNRARALLADGLLGEAQLAYRQALEIDPVVEDQGLAARLSGKVVEFSAARPRAIASGANDPTDRDDVVHMTRAAEARVMFEDVGGLDLVKAEVRRRIITPFLKPSLFQKFKRNSGGGILLYGPPGCGKTLLARATAGECNASFINVAITDVLDMYIGESERKLHAIFEQARRTAPAVVFFDEMEALGGKRQHLREATSAKLVSQFLTELDGFSQNNAGVLILGATNVPWAIDPAFRRPGRFDRVLFVTPPDAPARRSIISRLLDERPTVAGLVVDDIVKATTGYSGADLRNLVETASDEAIEASMDAGEERPITADHLRSAIRSVKPTTLEWLTSARNHARYSNQNGQYDEVLKFLDQHG